MRSSLTRAIPLASLGLSVLLTAPTGQSKPLLANGSLFSADLAWQSGPSSLPTVNTQTIHQALKFSLYLDKDSRQRIGSLAIEPGQGFTHTRIITSLISAFLEQGEGKRKEIPVRAVASNKQRVILVYLSQPIMPGNNLTLYAPIKTAPGSTDDYTLKIETFPAGSNHRQPPLGSSIIQVQADEK